MSLVKKLILDADAETRYFTPGELDQLMSFAKRGEHRLRIAQALTANRERIVKQAGEQLFQRWPSIVSPGGNAYGEGMTATCLRDMDYYMRLITYAVVAGNFAPLDDIGVVGVRHMYNSLGTPIDAMVESIRALQRVATSNLSGEDASEVGTYFNYLVLALE